MWAGLHAGYWICLLLAVPAAGFLVRLFMIQHDCGHGSFFRHRLAKDWVELTLMLPYDRNPLRDQYCTDSPSAYALAPWRFHRH
jgi:fatty acid desaturase